MDQEKAEQTSDSHKHTASRDVGLRDDSSWAPKNVEHALEKKRSIMQASLLIYDTTRIKIEISSIL